MGQLEYGFRVFLIQEIKGPFGLEFQAVLEWRIVLGLSIFFLITIYMKKNKILKNPLIHNLVALSTLLHLSASRIPTHLNSTPYSSLYSSTTSPYSSPLLPTYPYFSLLILTSPYFSLLLPTSPYFSLLLPPPLDSTILFSFSSTSPYFSLSPTLSLLLLPPPHSSSLQRNFWLQHSVVNCRQQTLSHDKN